MKKILFTTEFSEHSPKVLEYAFELALIYDAELLLLHAIKMPPKVLTPDDKEVDFDLRSIAAQKKLTEFKKEHQKEKYKGITVSTLVKVGLAADVIRETAKQEKVDLIVMGAQGSTNSIDKYFGGVAYSVMEKTACPILLIPPKTEFSSFSHLICALNFRFQDFFILKIMGDWANHYNAKLTCLHVVEDGESELLASKKSDLLVSLLGDKYDFQFEIRSGSLAKSIEKYASRTKGDLLAMVHHKKGFVTRLRERSVTQDVAREIQIPLFVYPNQ